MTNPQANAPQDQPIPPAVEQPTEAAPKKKSKAPKIILIAALVLVAAGFGIYNFMFGAGNAKVGDCLKGDINKATSIEKVDCGSADAKYSVVGRVENKTEADVNAPEESHACAAFEKVTAVYWESSGRSKTGALLCLGDKK